ncbi:MAG: DUF1361 domain-containing protein [Candidatus Saccharimonadales bacterium]
MKIRVSAYGEYVLTLAGMSLASLGLYAYGALQNHELAYSYLVVNLFLAWLPLVFALRLTRVLGRKLWSSWEALGCSALWLVFLPNSFYMISDFIHLQEAPRVDVLYDATMFTAFIFTGVALGLSSLYLLHRQFRQRFRPRAVVGLLAFTLLVCSVAVYVGRDLRWNSWDILINPGGLLFDLSDRLGHPASYPAMSKTVLSFWLLLGGMYLLVWRASRLLRKAV